MFKICIQKIHPEVLKTEKKIERGTLEPAGNNILEIKKNISKISDCRKKEDKQPSYDNQNDTGYQCPKNLYKKFIQRF